MRILAVDPGSKRIGLAISDPTETIATALATIPAEPGVSLAERLARVAGDQGVERIVVGLPRRMDGSRGPEAAAVERLASKIRAVSGLPVVTVDERLTTAAAERSLIEGGASRKERRLFIDRVAATLLLQGHLDRLKSDKRRAG